MFNHVLRHYEVLAINYCLKLVKENQILLTCNVKLVYKFNFIFNQCISLKVLRKSFLILTVSRPRNTRQQTATTFLQNKSYVKQTSTVMSSVTVKCHCTDNKKFEQMNANLD